jgi:DNA-binding protein H-NS
MALVDLKHMDVDALLELRADVDRRLTEQARDLQRQLSLLSGGAAVRGRPAGRSGRPSGLKGTKVPPKYRGPGGETWAGRGARPRWLTALLKEGHSMEEFSISAGRKAKTTAAKRTVVKKRGRTPARSKSTQS